ncbi:choline dehydrogenase [Stagonosporopsis vannaccii]|nr:choline dehydrogenase [Stagonosporopsis vannaccii]
MYKLHGVGKDLHDHLNCGLSCEVQDNIPTRDEAVRDPKQRKAAWAAAWAEYKQHRTGRMAEGPAHSFAFTLLQMLEIPSETRSLSDSVHTYVEAECNSSLRAPHYFYAALTAQPDAESMPEGTPPFVGGIFVTVVAMLAHPFSRGSSHIKPSPSEQPETIFNYLSHAFDTEVFARHMRVIEQLFQAPMFSGMRKPDGKRLPRSFPHPLTSLDEAKGILPINSATNHHPCGTCSMTREELGGVVDWRLRLYGTRNVKVCDASVLPIIPRGNILAAVYGFAEKAADLIYSEIKAGVVWA